jgi:hypothetical protein
MEKILKLFVILCFIAVASCTEDSNEVTTQAIPKINVSTNSVLELNYIEDTGPSNVKSFMVSGSNLLNNIELNAPTNFEISTNSESNFGITLSLAANNNSVNETSIYVRLQSGLSINTYSGDIKIASSEIDETVNLNGEVKASAVTYPTFDQSLLLESTSETSANIAFGDLNGNGNLDIVLAKGRHWPLYNRIIFGDGNGGIMTSENLGTVQNRTYSSIIIDLDLDGDLDIVVSNDSPDPKITYLNDGNGGFYLGSEYGNPNWNTRNVNVADLNNDGYPDILVANRDGSGGPTNNYLCLNNGSGGFDNNCIAFSNYSSTTITSGDFNNDNLIDLVVPHRDGGQSYVYLQTDQNTINFDLIPFGPSNASIRTSQVGDLNNDGLVDIVTIDTNNGVIAYFQQSDSSFSTGKSIGNEEASPKALTLGDLNLDGNIDIIVGFVQSSSIVYYNNDNANNFLEVEFGENNQGTVYGFALGDYNNDGHIDIAAAKSGAPNILYFGQN